MREPSERVAFWLTGLGAFPAALLIGYVLHESIGASQVALFIVIAMLYVTLARGRLLGSSVRIHQTQYPRVFSIVQNAAAALEIPTPLIFVREDNFVPAVALGLGQPYALVLSSHWIELFSDDELAFVIGRELGHIAAGHTRFHSLLSVNGNENPLISLIFGGWLRRCALTCDKVGLLCCGSLDAAIGALGVATFHAFGRQVDYQAFAEQRAEIATDSVLRWGEWLSSEPYATQRIASMRRFITSPSYLDAQAWFVRERGEAPPALVLPGEATVAPRDCAGWWRRFAAAGIDAVVVIAIVTSFGGSVAPATRQSETNISVTPGNVTASAPGLGAITIRGKTHAVATGGSPSPRRVQMALGKSGRNGSRRRRPQPLHQHDIHNRGADDPPSRLLLLVPGLPNAARSFRGADLWNDDYRFARGNDRLSQTQRRAHDLALHYRILGLVAYRRAEFLLAPDSAARSVDEDARREGRARHRAVHHAGPRGSGLSRVPT